MLTPRRRRLVYLTGFILTAAVLGLVWPRQTSTAPTSSASTGQNPSVGVPSLSSPRPAEQPAAASSAPAENADLPAPALDPTVHAALGAFLAELKSGRLDRATVLARLKALKAAIHALPPDVAAATLIAWLDAAQDAATGLSFQVGPEGVMSETPTFRTALLDWLGQTDPSASLEYSRDLLAANPRAEEYALALRNIAWLNPDGEQTSTLRQGFLQLLNNPELTANPSPGYLESFDIAVAVADAGLVRDLLAYQGARTGNDYLSRATFIALDRIMLRSPEVILDVFAANPAFLSDQPNWRASLLARLDPSDPKHVEQLNNYLLKTPHTEAELNYFSSIYPLANFFEGNRLVTDWETVNQKQTIPERDASASKLVTSLVADPAYKKVADSLNKILKRLGPPPPPADVFALTPAL